MSFAENRISGLSSITATIGQDLTNIISKYVGIAYSGTETGAPLMSAIDAGGAVTGEEFAYSIGAQQVTDAQGSQINSELVDAQSQQAQSMSLGQRLFSTSYDNSVVSQLARAVPVSGKDMVGGASNYAMAVLTTPSKLFAPLLSWLTGQAHADNTSQDNYGLTDYDFTDAELAQPLANDMPALTAAAEKYATDHDVALNTVTFDEIDGSVDCPRVDQTKEANMCELDLVAIQSLGAQYTSGTSLSLEGGGN